MEQRLELMYPPNGEWELAAHYTFSKHDLSIINRHRQDYNRLGFAVQLALLRFPGWSITDIKDVPNFLIEYLAKQLNIAPEVFLLYARRENTLWDHLKEIRDEYNFSTFTTNDYNKLSDFLFQQALENENAIHLVRAVLDELRRLKIILPAITTIEMVVWESRNSAEKWIYGQFHEALTSSQKQKLDNLINPVSATGRTTLGWLKKTTGKYSPEAFLKVVERLECIRKLNLNMDTTAIHPNRLRQLSRLGARYEPQSFRRFHETKRYAVMTAYLMDLSQSLVDQAFDIHDKQILTMQSKGRKKQEALLKQNGKAVNEKVIHYADLGVADHTA